MKNTLRTTRTTRTTTYMFLRPERARGQKSNVNSFKQKLDQISRTSFHVSNLISRNLTFRSFRKYYKNFIWQNLSLWCKLVFCFRNCSDLLFKKCSIERDNVLKGQDFANSLRQIKQFIQTVKVQNIFWNRMFFLTFSWRFLRK